MNKEFVSNSGQIGNFVDVDVGQLEQILLPFLTRKIRINPNQIALPPLYRKLQHDLLHLLQYNPLIPLFTTLQKHIKHIQPIISSIIALIKTHHLRQLELLRFKYLPAIIVYLLNTTV